LIKINRKTTVNNVSNRTPTVDFVNCGVTVGLRRVTAKSLDSRLQWPRQRSYRAFSAQIRCNLASSRAFTLSSGTLPVGVPFLFVASGVHHMKSRAVTSNLRPCTIREISQAVYSLARISRNQ